VATDAAHKVRTRFAVIFYYQCLLGSHPRPRPELWHVSVCT
jgi:hypothetical protein